MAAGVWPMLFETDSLLHCMLADTVLSSADMTIRLQIGTLGAPNSLSLLIFGTMLSCKSCLKGLPIQIF